VLDDGGGGWLRWVTIRRVTCQSVSVHLIRRDRREREGKEGRKARKCPFPALFMRLEINIKNNVCVCVGYGLKMIR
jgi:hypothetical protein